MELRKLFIVSALSLLILNGIAETAAETPELNMQEVSYTTRDEVTIYASWIVAQAEDGRKRDAPVAILLHDYGLDRRDWGLFIPDLVARGYHVLAPDIRGHGKSTYAGQRFSGRYSSQADSSLLRVGALDVEAALQWVKTQKRRTSKHIVVIGVGLGADIAYGCAGQFRKQIDKTVVISPSLLAVTDGRSIDNTPRNVLFIAATQDEHGSSMIAAESLANFTDDPKRLVLYDSRAHGLALFYKHPEIKQEILAWLQS